MHDPRDPTFLALPTQSLSMRSDPRYAAGLLAIMVVSLAPALLAQAPSEELPELPETEVRAAPPANAQPAPTNQPPAAVAGDSILDGTLFDSPAVSGYRANSSTSGTIIDVPDSEIPATVNTIPREVLDDQIVLEFEDLIRNAGGVTRAGDGQFGDRIFIRGLEVNARSFRKDGFLDPTFVPRDFQNVERVEILKGPASVLYGAGDAAGTVNVITKSPLQQRFAEFGYTFGSYNQNRFTLDANGYVDREGGNILYRLNVAQEDSDSFVDFDYLERTQVAPAITWLVNEDTSLTWKGEWHRHNTIGFQGTPAINGDPLFLPPNRFIGQPGSDFQRTEEFRQSLVLEHQLNDAWALHVGGYSLFYRYPSSTTSTLSTFPAGFAGQEAPIGRAVAESPVADEESHSAIANLAGEFCTGSWHHTALAGVEYNYFNSRTQFALNGIGTPIPPPDFVFPSAFDAANPTYGNPTPTVPLFGLDTNAFRQQRVGGYLQDLIKINDYWSLLGGVRFDTVDFTFDRVVTGGGVTTPLRTEQTFNRTSPRGGIVWHPTGDELISAYYNYAQSFRPPGGGAYFDFAPLQPVLGQSHEAGVKVELLPGLSVNAAGFHTTRENDTFVLSPGMLSQVGEVRSQGAELNVIGSLTERWNLIANYTYTDARLSDSDPDIDGSRARNVPYNAVNLWTRYDLYQDGCQTWGAALGYIYQDRRAADLENDLFLPSYSRWDAGLYYQRDSWRANVYLENLFDVQYAASSLNELQIFQGAPFNARASISYLY